MRLKEVERNKKCTSCFKRLISPSDKNKTKKTSRRIGKKSFFFFSSPPRAKERTERSDNLIAFKATALKSQGSGKSKTSFIPSAVLICWKECFII